MAESQFQLIDLTSDIAFTFQYFPENVRWNGRANWQPQETTAGVKPLHYANNEPKRVTVQELILDGTETDRSLQPDIEDLEFLTKKTEGRGTPPPLLAIWGDHKERCVLEDYDVEEIMFNRDGQCTRARIMISLLELQPEGESTRVRVVGT